MKKKGEFSGSRVSTKFRLFGSLSSSISVSICHEEQNFSHFCQSARPVVSRCSFGASRVPINYAYLEKSPSQSDSNIAVLKLAAETIKFLSFPALLLFSIRPALDLTRDFRATIVGIHVHGSHAAVKSNPAAYQA